MNKIPQLNLIWLLRYWLGIMLIYHSHWLFFDLDAVTGFTEFVASNGFPIPEILAYTAKLIEFFGGIFLVLGLFTRQVSLLVIVVLGVATFYFHKGLVWGEGELAFNYLLMAIILFFKPDIPFKLTNYFVKNNNIKE